MRHATAVLNEWSQSHFASKPRISGELPKVCSTVACTTMFLITFSPRIEHARLMFETGFFSP